MLKNDTVRPGNDIGLLIAILTAYDVYRNYDIDFIITSLNDSTHSQKSLHYADRAVDIRTKNIPESIGAYTIVKEIQDRLNKHYDVILENTHIHIEFQPQRI